MHEFALYAAIAAGIGAMVMCFPNGATPPHMQAENREARDQMIRQQIELAKTSTHPAGGKWHATPTPAQMFPERHGMSENATAEGE